MTQPARTATVARSAPRRRPSRTYQVTWLWRDEDPDATRKVDEVTAPDALSAITTLRCDLGREYADIHDVFWPIEVVLT